jgi:glutamate carboxypeptidase
VALGAADTNVLGSRGVPALDGFGPRGGGAHAEHEHISLASLTERTVLLAALLAAVSPATA